ncbi:phage GP46 family protein [Pseudomonas fontis]|uniref:Phage GP46 family protein n=1 Tax=Pseudomonas fontis TaxID=2942633 RepID=A0ABT5NPI9_9PSED|nr:phage GP46 family protein [Pseudomonas fontis]MDD0972443.1 phage GP46 family protein [Pseudomonas fontis]MDD0990100.1 phage GP46 family protein [Pseudomonas fontis]
MIEHDDLHASLNRAVLISLFSWRRAEPDDPVDDEQRYGWWGDSFPGVANDRIGSRLWLLQRVRLTEQTRRDAEFYAREALQWLIDDGHCRAVEVLGERAGINRLNLRTTLVLNDGERLDINLQESWQVTYAL